MGSLLPVSCRIDRVLGGGVVFGGVVGRCKWTLRWSKLADSGLLWVAGG